MNKKGQTLIIFVILIPIIITIIAVVTDMGILTHEFQKTKEIIDLGIENYYEKKELKEIETILIQNNVPTENLQIKENEKSIEVSVDYKIDSLFGSIINIKNYKIEITRIGTKEENTIKITNKNGAG